MTGEDDVFIDNGFIAALPYATLWEDTVPRLPGIGHAPFREVPDQFDPYPRGFMASL